MNKALKIVMISLIAASYAARAGGGEKDRELSDPRAEIAFRSSVEMVIYAAAIRLGSDDPEVGAAFFSTVDSNELIEKEIIPIIKLIEQKKPYLLLDPISKLEDTLKQLPKILQPDGKTTGKGIYEAEKKKSLERFGPKGLGSALAARFHTKLHNQRGVLKNIELSFQRPHVKIRGEDFCNAVLSLGMFVAASNVGAGRSAEDAKLFTKYDIDKILNDLVRIPFRALNDAAIRDLSKEGEKMRNAEVVEKIVNEVAALKDRNKDVEAFFKTEREKALQAYEGNEVAASAYVAVVCDTVVEICAEKLGWVIKYPIYAKNGLDWSSFSKKQ